jgi:hypothetical protein
MPRHARHHRANDKAHFRMRLTPTRGITWWQVSVFRSTKNSPDSKITRDQATRPTSFDVLVALWGIDLLRTMVLVFHP